MSIFARKGIFRAETWLTNDTIGTQASEDQNYMFFQPSGASFTCGLGCMMSWIYGERNLEQDTLTA